MIESFSYKKILKVNWVFENGHLFLSKIENLKIVLKKTFAIDVCVHNALKY